VGWGREATTKEDSIEAYLQSSDAYDIVYQTLYNALPDCRNCACGNFLLAVQGVATGFVC
jgi:hypothetical protein